MLLPLPPTASRSQTCKLALSKRHVSCTSDYYQLHPVNFAEHWNHELFHEILIDSRKGKGGIIISMCTHAESKPTARVSYLFRLSMLLTWEMSPVWHINTISEPLALALPLDWIYWQGVLGKSNRTIREQWQLSKPSSAIAVATMTLYTPFLKALKVCVWSCKARLSFSACGYCLLFPLQDSGCSRTPDLHGCAVPRAN